MFGKSEGAFGNSFSVQQNSFKVTNELLKKSPLHATAVPCLSSIQNQTCQVKNCR
jgi:hypothetical protein